MSGRNALIGLGLHREYHRARKDPDGQTFWGGGVGGAHDPGRGTCAAAPPSGSREDADSAADLAQALRLATDAHGRHEEEIGHPDPDWPD